MYVHAQKSSLLAHQKLTINSWLTDGSPFVYQKLKHSPQYMKRATRKFTDVRPLCSLRLARRPELTSSSQESYSLSCLMRSHRSLISPCQWQEWFSTSENRQQLQTFSGDIYRQSSRASYDPELVVSCWKTTGTVQTNIFTNDHELLFWLNYY